MSKKKGKASSTRKRLANLEGLISSNSNLDLLEEYNKCKSDLESLYNYITVGIILRSKSECYEHGEKSSKYFLNLEKRNKAKSHTRKLLTSSDVEISKPPDIMNHIKEFYASLYKWRSAKTEQDCLEYLRNINIPQLSQSERDSCEGLLMKRECWKVLSPMKNNKSPGNDGLTKKFYICFFNEFSDCLVQALKESFNVSQLSTSQRQATITVIEKKDKDKRFIKNWRPISLINVDTKIAYEVLAMRMQNILTSIISHHHQTVYVNGRYIDESIRLISDILEYAEDNSMGEILFSADFKKAFDSVEHMFIFATLQSFGFGPQFIH